MLNSIVEINIVNKLYNDANSVFTKFHSEHNNIEEFVKIAKEIEMLLYNISLKYRYLSILGSPTQHSVNVAILNGLIGMLFNLENILDLILGGLLHDLGKFYIPEEIRDKPGKLSDEERREMAKHTDIGYELLKREINNNNVLNIVKNHHNTINSLSSPVCIRDMKGDLDTLFPLVCGVSDITDAMLSYRTYKKPFTIKDTEKELKIKGIKNIETIFRQVI